MHFQANSFFFLHFFYLLHWKCEHVNNNKVQEHKINVYIRGMMSVCWDTRWASFYFFLSFGICSCDACFADFILLFFSFKWHFKCCCFWCCLFTAYILSFYCSIFSQIEITFYACGCHPFCINDFLLLCVALRHCKMCHKIFENVIP